MIGESLVNAVERSEEDFKAGQYKVFETKEDMFKHMNNLRNEDE